MKHLVIFLVCMLVSLSSVAATIWSESTTIKIVYPTQSTLAFIVEYTNPISTCDHGTRYQLDENASNYNVQASTLLAAFMAGKEVVLGIDDSQSPICSPIVNRFRVYP